ncbi:hypothetical protein [Bradyrhizobium ottawaense]|uniref:hypothetical protein n=1 Tax=Bradyrhizobium ottawaense TaxID=931866 RepID=UPI0027D6DEB1|nr:hypothetical protein BwSG10_68740 [Bradyrhizobium ottawaense]GMP00205.1 hypothetical protein BwSH20_27990 [Bradyrhizobium ottawaense]GMP11681.1 hypothetical protein BwDG23_68740 [Bradyrhizobium ottawaense]GMP15823.1 hypothetical protein BwSH12_18250 [Bradyrhizobium ottawaense]
MANKTKAESAAAATAANVPRMGFSIMEWCARYGFSEGFYRTLRKNGRSPKEGRLGRRVIITAEADDEWRRTVPYMDEIDLED